LIAVCVSRAAMVNGTAEEQFRARARRALEAGEPYPARGAKNKAILEEVRKEVARARKEVQAAAHAGQEAVRRQTRKGKGEIQEATTQGKRELENVVQDAAKRLKNLAIAAISPLEAPGEPSAASSAGEVVTTDLAVLSAPPPAPRPETPATEQGEERAPQEEKEADEDMIDDGRVPPSDLEELHIAEQEAEKQSLEEAAPSKSAAEVEEGQLMPSAEQEPMRAIVTEGLHELRAGADEPAPAPAADAPEWTSESDDASATEEDEVDEAEGEERVAQTVVEGDVAPLTPAVATVSQALVPLSQEAAQRTPWELLCEANVQRRRATTEEHARLAPDLAQHLRRTYDRLAVQHGWPALADGAALPEDIAAAARWFFEMKSPFQNALKEKRREAVTRALSKELQRRRSKCLACRDWDPWDVDPACALHRALSAVDEVRLEMALRTAWAEEALTYAVNAWRQQAAAAERARLASLAREEEDSVERERRYAVEERARQMLRPKASKCAACADADFGYGGLCHAHQEELETLCEGLQLAGGQQS
jgi:hypothetical protein